MVRTVEARSHASEVKFVVDPDVGEQIRRWARIYLVPDPYGAGPCLDEYQTTTLYFDTSEHDVYHRRGSFGRAKYRIRRYGAAETAFLERKLRRTGLLIKRRTQIAVQDLDRLDGQSQEGPWPGGWFERRLVARDLGPACQVTYRRMARDRVNRVGRARLTLDQSIHATALAHARFVDDGGVPVLPDRMVLELKFIGHLPVDFKRLVEHFKLSPQTPSKYRFALAKLIGFDPPDLCQPFSFDRKADAGLS